MTRSVFSSVPGRAKSVELLASQETIIEEFLSSNSRPYWQLKMLAGNGKTEIVKEILSRTYTRSPSQKVLIIGRAELIDAWTSILQFQSDGTIVETWSRGRILEFGASDTPFPHDRAALIFVPTPLIKLASVREALQKQVWDLIVADWPASLFRLPATLEERALPNLFRNSFSRKGLLIRDSWSESLPKSMQEEFETRSFGMANLAERDDPASVRRPEAVLSSILYRRSKEERDVFQLIQLRVLERSDSINSFNLEMAGSSSFLAVEFVLRERARQLEKFEKQLLEKLGKETWPPGFGVGKKLEIAQMLELLSDPPLDSKLNCLAEFVKSEIEKDVSVKIVVSSGFDATRDLLRTRLDGLASREDRAYQRNDEDKELRKEERLMQWQQSGGVLVVPFLEEWIDYSGANIWIPYEPALSAKIFAASIAKLNSSNRRMPLQVVILKDDQDLWRDEARRIRAMRRTWVGRKAGSRRLIGVA